MPSNNINKIQNQKWLLLLFLKNNNHQYIKHINYRTSSKKNGTYVYQRKCFINLLISFFSICGPIKKQKKKETKLKKINYNAFLHQRTFKSTFYLMVHYIKMNEKIRSSIYTFSIQKFTNFTKLLNKEYI